MTIVIGTAGHIDHGKTTLLRALTGIDADRLPEERRRGMTIDVGYAHLRLDDGSEIDFVDVPGHDRLVGNMLVGAGEIDAAMLVVAADDGPRAQTLEHLSLLDALDIRHGLAVVTKVDLLEPDDARRDQLRAEVASLLAETTLAGVPVVLVSAVSGEGLGDLREALIAVRDRALADGPPGRSARLAIDRVFTIRGHGIIVTGSLRGGTLETGSTYRLEPGPAVVRVREVQVHGEPRASVSGGGRAALNLAGVEPSRVRRGHVLTDSPAVTGTDRLLVRLRSAAQLGPQSRPARVGSGRPARRQLNPGATLRLHVGTDQVDATLRSGRWEDLELADGGKLAILRLAAPVAAAVGDVYVLRWPSPGEPAAGGRVLDTDPPVGPSRRRMRADRLRALSEASDAGAFVAALVEIHGALDRGRAGVLRAELSSGDSPSMDLAGPSFCSAGPVFLAWDVVRLVEQRAVELVTGHHAVEPLAGGMRLAELRVSLTHLLRRLITLGMRQSGAAVDSLIEGLVERGSLDRAGDLMRPPGLPTGLPPVVQAAMDRLVELLEANAPPSLTEALATAGCPAEGLRSLEATGRIVRLEPDLAYAATAYSRLERMAIELARNAPVTPAAFRDASGTSRRFVLAILEDLDRRGMLRRTPAGHVLGPRVVRR